MAELTDFIEMQVIMTVLASSALTSLVPSHGQVLDVHTAIAVVAPGTTSPVSPVSPVKVMFLTSRYRPTSFPT